MPRLRVDFCKLMEIKRRKRSEHPGFCFLVAALSALALIGGSFSLGNSLFDPFIVFDFHPWIAALLLPWIVAFLSMGIYYKIRLKRDALLKDAIYDTWGRQDISFGEGLHGDGIRVIGRVTDGHVEINPFQERD